MAFRQPKGAASSGGFMVNRVSDLRQNREEMINNSKKNQTATTPQQPSREVLQGGDNRFYEPEPPTTHGVPRGTKNAAANNSNGTAFVLSSGATEAELVNQLQQKLDKQKSELDNRTDNVNAIQRNFQRLSEMYSGDRSKLVEAENKIVVLENELEALRAEKKVHQALRVEYTQLKAEKDEEGQQQNEKLEKLSGELQDVTRRLQECEMEKKSLMKKNVELLKEIDAGDSLKESMLAQIAPLEHATDKLLDGLMLIQRTCEFPDYGAGISFLTRGGGGNLKGGNSSSSIQLAADTRMLSVTKSLALCTSDAIRPLADFQEKKKGMFESQSQEISKKHQAELLDLKSANEKLKNKNAETEVQLAGLRQQVKDLRQCYDADVKSYKNQILTAEKSAQDSKNLLQRLQHQTEAEEKSWKKDLQDRNESLSLENKMLREIVEQLQADVKNLTQKNEKMKNEKDENGNKSFQERELWNAKFAELKHANQLLATEREMLDLQNAELRQENNAYATTEIRYKDKIQVLEKELQAQASRAQQSQDCEKLSRQLADAYKQLKATEGEREKLVTTLSSTRAELHQLTFSHEALQKEFQRLAAELQNLKNNEDGRSAAAQTSLVEKGKIISDLEEELLHYQNKTKQYMEEIDSFRKQHDEVVAQLQSNFNKLSKECHELRSGVNTGNDQVMRLQKKCEEVEKSRDEAERRASDANKHSAQLLRTHEEFMNQKTELEQKMKIATLRSQQLRQLEEECFKTVKRILAAEQSCESSYSCQQCLNLLKNPIICAPCGHVFCNGCFEAENTKMKNKNSGKNNSKQYCSECNGFSVTDVIESESLDVLSGKFSLRCQQLNNLANMLDRELHKQTPDAEK